MVAGWMSKISSAKNDRDRDFLITSLQAAAGSALLGGYEMVCLQPSHLVTFLIFE